VEEHRDTEVCRDLADRIEPRCVRGERLHPRVELDAAHSVVPDAAGDLGCSSGIVRVDRCERDIPSAPFGREPRERIVRGRAGPAQAVEGEDRRELDAER